MTNKKIQYFSHQNSATSHFTWAHSHKQYVESNVTRLTEHNFSNVFRKTKSEEGLNIADSEAENIRLRSQISFLKRFYIIQYVFFISYYKLGEFETR